MGVAANWGKRQESHSGSAGVMGGTEPGAIQRRWGAKTLRTTATTPGALRPFSGFPTLPPPRAGPTLRV